MSGCRFWFWHQHWVDKFFFSGGLCLWHSSSLNYCVYMIDDLWNRPLEVEGSRCSVKTLVCHYMCLWCEMYSTASSLWERLFFSSSLKGHYGMGKPSWPKAKYIICLLAPGEHTSQSRLTPVRTLRILAIFQSHTGIGHPLKSAVFIVLDKHLSFLWQVTLGLSLVRLWNGTILYV